MLRVIHIPNRTEPKRGGRFIEDIDFVEWVYYDWTEGVQLDGDLMWIMYDPADANYRLNMANKYFTAQVNHIPVMVSTGTYMAERVNRNFTGYAIPYQLDSIKNFLDCFAMLARPLNLRNFNDNDYQGTRKRFWRIFE